MALRLPSFVTRFLCSLVLLVGWTVACSATGGRAASGGGGDTSTGGSSSSGPLEGLTSISITPTTAALSLQYPVSSTGATTQLTAQGKFQDGHSADVTAQVSLSLIHI